MVRRAIRSILVATDLTPESDSVVRAAAGIAASVGAELHTVHALEDRGLPFGDAGFDLLAMQEVIHGAREKMTEQLERVLPQGIRVGSVRIEYRAAPAAILGRAKSTRADLIVMGPHRGRIPGSHLFGSTARRVLEQATAPCLVARGELPRDLRRILLAIGEEDVERGLLPTAAGWIAALRRQQTAASPVRALPDLRVLHVVRTPDQWRDFSPAFAAAMRDAGADPVVDSQLRIRRAVAWNRSPAEEIVRIAASTSVDLIALGVCGKGPLLHALLGSVSANVLKYAEGSVIIFPPQVCEMSSRRAEVVPFPMQGGVR